MTHSIRLIVLSIIIVAIVIIVTVFLAVASRPGSASPATSRMNTSSSIAGPRAQDPKVMKVIAEKNRRAIEDMINHVNR